MSKISAFLLMGLTIFLLTSCGGDKQSQSTPPPNSPEQPGETPNTPAIPLPQLIVDFPPSNFISIAQQTRVRGRIIHPNAFLNLTINGKSLSTSVAEDGTLVWETLLPINSELNVIELNAQFGGETPSEQNVTVALDGRVRLWDPRAMAFNQDFSKVLIVDRASDSLLEFDLINETFRIVSDNLGRGIPAGQASFLDPIAVALDEGNQLAWVLDVNFFTQEALLHSVDLESGLRRAFPLDNNIFLFPANIILMPDSNGQVGLVADSGKILEVGLHPENGITNIKIFADNTDPMDPELEQPQGMVFNETGDKLYLTNGLLNNHILAIDLSNGDREVEFDNTNQPTDAKLGGPHSLSLISGANALLAINAFFNENRVLKGILNSNAPSLSVVSKNFFNDGPKFRFPRQVVAEDADQAWVLNRGPNHFLKVNLNDGNRTNIIEPFHLSKDPEFLGIDSVAFALMPEPNKLLISDKQENSIYVLDFNTGEIKFLFNNLPNNSQDLLVNANQDRIFIDSVNSIFAYDINTGENQEIFNISTSVNSLNGILAMEQLSDSSLIVLFSNKDDSQLLRVNPITGESEVISDNSSGGIVWQNPRAMALDEANNRALVVDFGQQAIILAVNLSSGERSVIADNSDPSQHFFSLNQKMKIALKDPDTAIVLDAGSKKLLRVNLADGTRSVITETEGLGIDWNFGVDSFLLLNQAHNVAYVATTEGEISDGISAVDLATGERVRYLFPQPALP